MQKESQSGPGTAIGRRAFVKGAGLTGLGIAGATLMAGKLDLLEKVEAATVTDTDILNFALNLEYLEAEFYTIATTGRRIEDFGIPTSGTGTPGPTTGGKKVNFKGEEDDDGDSRPRPPNPNPPPRPNPPPAPDQDGGEEFSGRLTAIAKEITFDEQQHVLDLRAALGAAAIAKPKIDLDALGIGFRDFRSFLQLSRAFEDTGVSAYGGAAPLITSKTVLSAAVRIGLTEALHSANIRLLVAENQVRTMPVDGKDVLPPPSGTKYFEVDQKAFTIVRTTSQVLAIVYHNSTPGTMKGGFFPDGVNGRINTV